MSRGGANEIAYKFGSFCLDLDRELVAESLSLMAILPIYRMYPNLIGWGNLERRQERNLTAPQTALENYQDRGPRTSSPSSMLRKPAAEKLSAIIDKLIEAAAAASPSTWSWPLLSFLGSYACNFNVICLLESLCAYI